METGDVRALTMTGSTLEAWRGGAWTARDTILLASGDAIYEVPASGGRLSRLMSVDEGEPDSPQLLPGGRAVLFHVAVEHTASDWLIVVESLETAQRHVVVEGGSDPQYVASGHILFVRAGTLMAVPFDVARLEATGAPIAVAEDVMHADHSGNLLLNTGAGQFSVSHSGALAYVPGGVYPSSLNSLVWVDHAGASEALPLPPGQYTHPRFSPDGTRLAYSEGRRGDRRRVWVYDIELATPAPLGSTLEGSQPVWSPDGTRVAFSSDDYHQLLVTSADGSGAPQQLTRSEGLIAVSSWSSDGVLVFVQGFLLDNQALTDIWTLSTDDGGSPQPVLETPFREMWPALSPDGRWLAYASDETGRFEVYVRPFPAGEPVHRVSTAGGEAVLWSPDGRQLFFRTYSEEKKSLEMMVVDVATDGSFTRGQPRTLFDGREFGGTTPVRSYDISPDGQRFVMLRASSDVEPQPATRINVVLNWFEELNELVPVY